MFRTWKEIGEERGSRFCCIVLESLFCASIVSSKNLVGLSVYIDVLVIDRIGDAYVLRQVWLFCVFVSVVVCGMVWS